MGCAPSIKLIIIRTNSKGELLNPNKLPSTFVNPSRGLKKATVSEIVPHSLEYGRRLFVIFATNEYRHFPSLQHPIRESKLIASAFEDRSFESRVYENFTKKQIVDVLFNLKVQPSDLLVLYFASHATATGDDVAYVVTSDSTNSDESLDDKLTNQELKYFAKICKARHLLIMFDCCFAGRFIQTRGLKQNQFVQNLQLQARLIITSGALESVPDESEFALALQQVLIDNPPPLSALDAFLQIRGKVETSLPLCSRWKPDDGGDIHI
jgi:hypothetical protein